jgi:hypothetical protein
LIDVVDGERKKRERERRSGLYRKEQLERRTRRSEAKVGRKAPEEAADESDCSSTIRMPA